eukprot:823068-Amphidinium_carterae.1
MELWRLRFVKGAFQIQPSPSIGMEPNHQSEGKRGASEPREQHAQHARILTSTSCEVPMVDFCSSAT